VIPGQRKVKGWGRSKETAQREMPIEIAQRDDPISGGLNIDYVLIIRDELEYIIQIPFERRLRIVCKMVCFLRY